MDTRKTIEVVAAVIVKDGKYFATQRGDGEWKDWWEFPGGKMEPAETPEEALRREISEELATEIDVGALLTTVLSTRKSSIRNYLTCKIISDDRR